MCTVSLPPGVNPIAVKYIISNQCNADSFFIDGSTSWEASPFSKIPDKITVITMPNRALLGVTNV
jgi:hypothetical protein